MTVLMQAPYGFSGPVIQSKATPSGHSYRIDSQGQVSANELDVGYLLGLGFSALIGPTGRTVDGGSYTLANSDNLRAVSFTSALATTVTVPVGLAKGFQCLLIAAGAGTVTVAAASGTTVNNRQSQTDSAGQWALMSIVAVPNTTDTYVLGGDTA